jgi:5-methylthioadenosine/S-adenosylhomocysteine deaminase
VALDLSAVELAPCYDPASHLVYSAGREHVSHVWVDGEPRVSDGELVGIDSRELQVRAAHWRERIRIAT